MAVEGKYPEHATRLQVRQVTYQAEGINSYELVHPDGDDLPAFEAGAHIDFFFRDGSVRQYSLCNDPTERDRYLIAVLREVNGRGGSEGLHERVHPQRQVFVGTPRNNFPLDESAERYLLLAGGIGVTPMMAMIVRLQALGSAYTLHYCAKSPRHAAFRRELIPFIKSEHVQMHYDGGDPRRGLDIEALLKDHEPGTQLYYCGPPGFMNAVRRHASHWPEESVHCEYFSAEASPRSKLTEVEFDSVADGTVGIGFQVQIASTGAVFSVPNDKSIVQVLAENGINIEVSCQSGLCGTCVTRYIEGNVDHHDLILDANKQKEWLNSQNEGMASSSPPRGRLLAMAGRRVR